jgi:hypothetical protein
MAFFQFLLNSAHEVLNDPESQYFLPKVLSSIKGDNSQGKLLPIEEESWVVGDITGDAGKTITDSFNSYWLGFLEDDGIDISGQYAMANPSTPFPYLAFGNDDEKKIEIVGLENIKVDRAEVLNTTDEGYELLVTLNFNQWTEANSGTEHPNLQLITPYQMSQNLCLANNGESTCNGTEHTDIDGNGMATITFEDAYLDVLVTMDIKGSGAQRQISISVTKVMLHGSEGRSEPSLEVSELTIDADQNFIVLGIWKAQATTAIESSVGTASIFQFFAEALNGSSNLIALSENLDQTLGDLLNGIFGTVADGGLPSMPKESGVNAVDQYLIDRFSYALNTQGSSWYLPQLLCSLTDPTIEPLIETEILLPDFELSGLLGEATDVSLSNVIISGISNIFTDPNDFHFLPSSLSFHAVLGELDPPPELECACDGVPEPPTNLKGNFSLVIKDEKLTGSMEIILEQPTFSVAVNSEGETVESLVITIQSMGLSFSDLKNFIIIFEIESVFKDIINKVLNRDSFKTMILEKINAALESNLEAISDAVTRQAKKIFSAGVN